MPRWPIVAKRRQTLLDLATPDTAGQPEVVPAIYYDTQSYVSTTTTLLTFFAAVNADRTLSNMDASGAFPDPQFFEIWFIGIDYLFPAVSTSGAVAGNVNDLAVLLNANRGIFTLQLSNKNYGPFPQRLAHGLGPVAPGTQLFQNSNATSQQAAGNGVPDGGFWVSGQIVIPPKVNFAMLLQWGAVTAIAATPLNICVQLIGTLHRRVL